MSFETAKTFLDKYRKEHPFVFYFLIIYLSVLAFYSIFYADTSKPMALNEVGDFLAGAFSPIAFLFLYLGYRQNSEALHIQAEELRQSTEALKLQVAEMKESVEQQKLIGQLQSIELNERHNSVAPVLNGYGSIDSTRNVTATGYESEFAFYFSLKNISTNDAKNIKINLDGGINEFSEEILGQHSQNSFKSQLTDDELEKYERKEKIERLITIDYENIFGRGYSQMFLFECNFENSSYRHSTTNLGAMMSIKNTQPH